MGFDWTCSVSFLIVVANFLLLFSSFVATRGRFRGKKREAALPNRKKNDNQPNTQQHVMLAHIVKTLRQWTITRPWIESMDLCLSLSLSLSLSFFFFSFSLFLSFSRKRNGRNENERGTGRSSTQPTLLFFFVFRNSSRVCVCVCVCVCTEFFSSSLGQTTTTTTEGFRVDVYT